MDEEVFNLEVRKVLNRRRDPAAKPLSEPLRGDRYGKTYAVSPGSSQRRGR
jgi:hypothetical protein